MADAEGIASLVNASYRGENSKQGWTSEADLLDGRRTDSAEIRRLLAAEHSIILCCRDGMELMGSVHIEKIGNEAALWMFVVDPAHQAQGIGKHLLKIAEETAQSDWGVRKMAMAVITQRHELIAFYKRRGYRRTGKLRPFPVNPAVWIPKVDNLQLELLEKCLDLAD